MVSVHLNIDPLNNEDIGAFSLIMPVRLPAGTLLQLQFDQNPPFRHIVQQESDWISIPGRIPELLRAENLTLSGNLANLNIQDSFTIPVAHLQDILEEGLRLIKSTQTVQDFVLAGRLNTGPQGRWENKWWWVLGTPLVKTDALGANVYQYRGIVDLVRDLYLFPEISTSVILDPKGGNIVLSVYFKQIQKQLKIDRVLEIADENEEEEEFAAQEQSTPRPLSMQMRFNNKIIQVSLPPKGQDSKTFSLEPLWPYLLKAREVSARWSDENGQIFLSEGEIQGLEYRLLQIYTAFALKKNLDK